MPVSDDDYVEPKYDILEYDGSISFRIKGALTDEIKQAFLTTDFDSLTIDSGSYHDLSFLVGQKDKIVDLSICSEDVDWGSLSELSELRCLYIDGWFSCPLEFKKLGKLEYFYGYWNKGYETTLKDLKKLKTLRLIGYKFDSIEPLGRLDSLTDLSFVQSRSLRSLDGIANARSLKFFEASNCVFPGTVYLFTQWLFPSPLWVDS